ncbi:MAG: PIN domain-containing protein [Sporichthyaceae bacterium]
MTVLDACAVIALVNGEAAGPAVRELLENSDCALTAVGLGEVVDQLVRRERVREEDALLDLKQLRIDRAIVVDAKLATTAGRLRARRYHREDCRVSLADCVAAECARATGRPLATSDGHLLTLCHLEGIAAIPLPNSSGSTWSAPT